MMPPLDRRVARVDLRSMKKSDRKRKNRQKHVRDG